MKHILNKFFAIILLVVYLTACAYRPVAFDQQQMFIGVFKSKQDNDGICTYNEIEGMGFKLGWFIFGLGYFNRKILTVHTQKSGVCRNEFVTVYLDNCWEEDKCEID